MNGFRFYASLILLMGVAGYAGFALNKYLLAPETDSDRTAASGTSREAAAPESLIGTHRPGFSLPDISGTMRRLSEWDGQVVVLNFWATWCPPCLKEVPAFIELQSRYGDQGLQFIGIAMQKPEDVVGFIQRFGMNYPVLTGETEVMALATAYGNTDGVLPYTVMIGRQGRIRFIKLGELSATEAEAAIVKLLEAA